MRRTSSIDVCWPDGRAGAMRLTGRARDILTPSAGAAPIICAQGWFEAVLQPDRSIVAIQSEPPRPALSRLIGQRGGGGLRKVLEEVVPEERRNATPLYLILDDISGASLVAGWAWSQWDPDWLAAGREALKGFDVEKAFRNREGICVGFAPGSSGLSLATDRSGTPTTDLRLPEDPHGWHAFTHQPAVGFRRARRIDVWQNDVIAIDSAFQDSATTAQGGRAVVHEYGLRASVDRESLRLLSVAAEPRVLPFAECPGAVANVTKLLGTPLGQLREKVLAELRGTAGCTHLNDALRALADVGALSKNLRPMEF